MDSENDILNTLSQKVNNLHNTIKDKINKEDKSEDIGFIQEWKISLLDSINNILNGKPEDILKKEDNKHKYSKLFYIILTILIFIVICLIIEKFKRIR